MGARAVQRGHHQHVLGRHALLDGDPAHLVDVALAVEEIRLAVVGAERAVVRAVLAHHRQQRAQVAGVGGLADQHPHAAAALLQRLLGGERLVVGRDSGRHVCVQRRAHDPGRVPVDVRGDHPLEHVRIAGDDAGEIHHLGHAERPGVEQDLAHVLGAERPDAATRSRSPGRTTAPSRRRRAAAHRWRRAASARPRRRPRSRSRAGHRPPLSSRAAPPRARTGRA